MKEIKIFLSILTETTGLQREIRISSRRLSDFVWIYNPDLIDFIFWAVWYIFRVEL